MEGSTSFLFPRVPCYHFTMLPYGSMVYHPNGTRIFLYSYSKMGINRLEIEWRIIFESISTKYSKWLTPLNQYIFRKYIPWLYLSLLNFSKIYYSKKVFFVPSDDHFFAYAAKLQVGVATHTKGGGV